jgi:hypothetical protein
MMATCYYCGRKARRTCAAFLARPICSSCCREKMNAEIKCPPACPHLTAAGLYREERGHRKKVQRLRLDEHLRTALPREDALELFLALEEGIMSVYRTNSSLTDYNVLEALQAATQGFRARSSGLVLPAPATSHIAKSLSESLEKVIEKYSTPTSEHHLEKDLILDALAKLAGSVRRHQAEPGGYLGFLSSFS